MEMQPLEQVPVTGVTDSAVNSSSIKLDAVAVSTSTSTSSSSSDSAASSSSSTGDGSSSSRGPVSPDLNIEPLEPPVQNPSSSSSSSSSGEISNDRSASASSDPPAAAAATSKLKQPQQQQQQRLHDILDGSSLALSTLSLALAATLCALTLNLPGLAWAGVILLGFIIAAPVVVGGVILARNHWLLLALKYCMSVAALQRESAVNIQALKSRFLQVFVSALSSFLLSLVGFVVAFYLTACYVVTAVLSVPLLDIATCVSLIPRLRKRFISQDLVFLESYKPARSLATALLQALPMTAIALMLLLAAAAPAQSGNDNTAAAAAAGGGSSSSAVSRMVPDVANSSSSSSIETTGVVSPAVAANSSSSSSSSVIGSGFTIQSFGARRLLQQQQRSAQAAAAAAANGSSSSGGGFSAATITKALAAALNRSSVAASTVAAIMNVGSSSTTGSSPPAAAAAVPAAAAAADAASTVQVIASETQQGNVQLTVVVPPSGAAAPTDITAASSSSSAINGSSPLQSGRSSNRSRSNSGSSSSTFNILAPDWQVITSSANDLPIGLLYCCVILGLVELFFVLLLLLVGCRRAGVGFWRQIVLIVRLEGGLRVPDSVAAEALTHMFRDGGRKLAVSNVWYWNNNGQAGKIPLVPRYLFPPDGGWLVPGQLCHLAAMAYATLASSSSGAAAVETLEIDHANGSDVAVLLGGALQNLPNVKALNLNWCQIGRKSLPPSLSTYKTLTTLSLNRCEIPDAGAQLIKTLMLTSHSDPGFSGGSSSCCCCHGECPKTPIDLECDKTPPADQIKTPADLHESKTPTSGPCRSKTSSGCGGDCKTPRGSVSLDQGFGSVGLRTLSVVKCHLGSGAVTALTEGLAGNKTLTHVQFTGNNGGRAAAAAFAAALRSNTQLQHLNIAFNKSTPAGGEALAAALTDLGSSSSSSSSLQRLILQRKEVGGAGLRSLIQALRRMTCYHGKVTLRVLKGPGFSGNVAAAAGGQGVEPWVLQIVELPVLFVCHEESEYLLSEKWLTEDLIRQNKFQQQQQQSSVTRSVDHTVLTVCSCAADQHQQQQHGCCCSAGSSKDSGSSSSSSAGQAAAALVDMKYPRPTAVKLRSTASMQSDGPTPTGSTAEAISYRTIAAAAAAASSSASGSGSSSSSVWCPQLIMLSQNDPCDTAAAVLRNVEGVQVADLSHLPLGTKGLKAISNALPQASSLQQLLLPNTGITEQGAAALAAALQQPAAAAANSDAGAAAGSTVPDQICINIGPCFDEQVTDQSEPATARSQIRLLDLSCNTICDSGATNLVNAIGSGACPDLKVLNLENNRYPFDWSTIIKLQQLEFKQPGLKVELGAPSGWCLNPSQAPAAAAAAAAAAAGSSSSSNSSSLGNCDSSSSSSSVHGSSIASEDLCGVCLDAPNMLSIRDCSHQLCTGCYKHLIKAASGASSGSRQQQHGTAAGSSAACPFCRQPMAGFIYSAWVHHDE